MVKYFRTYELSYAAFKPTFLSSRQLSYEALIEGYVDFKKPILI